MGLTSTAWEMAGIQSKQFCNRKSKEVGVTKGGMWIRSPLPSTISRQVDFFLNREFLKGHNLVKGSHRNIMSKLRGYILFRNMYPPLQVHPYLTKMEMCHWDRLWFWALLPWAGCIILLASVLNRVWTCSKHGMVTWSAWDQTLTGLWQVISQH